MGSAGKPPANGALAAAITLRGLADRHRLGHYEVENFERLQDAFLPKAAESSSVPHDPQAVRLRGGLVAGRRLGLRLGRRERDRLRSSLNHVRRRRAPQASRATP
jgi:hypothetical protein